MSFCIRVFLINEDQDQANSLIEMLSNIEDIEIVGEAPNRETALGILGELLPNVVLVDEDIPEGPFGLAEEISQRFINMAVIILGLNFGEDCYRKLLQVGARDLIHKPIEPAALVECIYGAYDYEKKRKITIPAKISDDTVTKRPKVITVFSNKGGVGATTIAVNLAVTLAKKYQYRTILWDLDLYHGIVVVATNIVQRQHLTDMLNEMQYLDQDLLESYLERHESGLMVLPAPFTPEFSDFVSAEHVNKIIAVAKENWDYIIIDAPSIFNETIVAAMRQSDSILLVGTLDLGTIKNLKACLMVMDKLNFSRARVKLILNKVGNEFGIFPKDVETTLKIPIFAAIPEDNKSVITGLNQGVPAAISLPDSGFGQSIDLLAKAISETRDGRKNAKAKRGLLGRLLNKNDNNGGVANDQ